MIHHKPVITLAGGLILALVSVACSSQPNARTSANQPVRDNVVASDRSAYQEDRLTSSNDRSRSTDRMASNERPVPTNRTGLDDNRVASDRIVPCADQKGDSTGSSDCASANRQVGDSRTGSDRTAYDSTAGARAACPSHTDAKGNVIYDDPSCPTRYRQTHQQMGSSFQNVDVTQESAFFDRHIGKAVTHARAAEIAGHLGNAPEMRQQAQLSLERAKEAQRAGNVPGLNEGIIELRETLSQPQGASVQDATAHVENARINLSRAGGMRPIDTRATGALAVRTNSMAGTQTRTVKGELISDEASGRVDGGQHYRVRDPQGKDIPISLSQDMGRTVREGDMVEAQLDSEGRVLAISKDR